MEMNKQILFIFLVAALVIVAGCGNGNSEGTIDQSGNPVDNADQALTDAQSEVEDLELSDVDSLDEDLNLI